MEIESEASIPKISDSTVLHVLLYFLPTLWSHISQTVQTGLWQPINSLPQESWDCAVLLVRQITVTLRELKTSESAQF